MTKSIIIICIVSITILFLAGCDLGGETEGENFFYNSSKLVVPQFAQSTGAGQSESRAPANWDWGNPMYELFNILQDYDPANDDMSIGLDNIYKLLYQAGSFYNSAVRYTESITEKVIVPPYDFGNDIAYNKAANNTADKHGYAIKEVDSKKYGIMTWNVQNNNDELGVFEGVYDEDTKDLTIDMVVYVQYDSDPDYSLRTQIIGNADSNSFTMRMLKRSEGGYGISIVGTGISRGAGNYFLFKLWDDSHTGMYYSFPADADEDTLKLMSDDGTDDAIDGQTNQYKAAVDLLTPFDPTDDVPIAVADFNTGVLTGTAVEGTIYINY